MPQLPLSATSTIAKASGWVAATSRSNPPTVMSRLSALFCAGKCEVVRFTPYMVVPPRLVWLGCPPACRVGSGGQRRKLASPTLTILTNQSRQWLQTWIPISSEPYKASKFQNAHGLLCLDLGYRSFHNPKTSNVVVKFCCPAVQNTVHPPTETRAGYRTRLRLRGSQVD